MITRYDAVLDGMSLTAIHPDIWVRDIRHTPATFKVESYTTAKRHGSRIYRRQAEKASVQITFEIHNYDTAIRQEICKSVAHWARKGGVLQTTDRPGQVLKCECESYPSITSALRWTDYLTVTFSAQTLPFWQESVPSTISFSGTSGGGDLYVPGVVDGAFAEVDILANATLTYVNVSAGAKVISLYGLDVASGNTIKIAYDENQIQSIKVGTTSLLDKRTGSDDLVVDCGEKTYFSFNSNANAQVTFRVRGLWL